MFCPLFFYISFFQISLLLCHDGQDGCHVGYIDCIIVINPVLWVVRAVCHSSQHSRHVGNIDSAIKVYIAADSGCSFYHHPFANHTITSTGINYKMRTNRSTFRSRNRETIG